MRRKVNRDNLQETEMSQAKNGDTVKVHYTGRLENGEIFANSRDGDPLEFTIGGGDLIPGFENGIVGMEVGETKTITVPPEDAYGSRHEELLVHVNKDQFPEDLTPAIGQELQIRQKEGDPLRVTVADIDEDTITLDANHPLAGYTLTFNILLVAVQ
jgi:peptidylprolyl isomerase